MVIYVHRRFQTRVGKKMVAIKEPTHIFSIRVPESLYRLLRQRSEELEVPQNRLILEGLQARLGDCTDAATPDTHRCRKDDTRRA